MTRAWQWWVLRCARLEDARALALVRIGVSVAILLDLVRVGQLGLVDVLFRPYALGGLSSLQTQHVWIDALPEGGRIAWIVAIGAFTLAALGVGTRPAILMGTLAYAQLGHMYSPGDRAIDRLLRTALLVLLFSGSHLRFSLLGKRADAVRAWPSDTLRLLLVIVYMTSGFAKLSSQPAWLATNGTPVLYRLMADPLAGHLDPHAALAWFAPLRVLGWGTVALELASPLIFTRWARFWAVGGICMHLGIALTMHLGMFSWGMLALYPVVVGPWRRGQVLSSTTSPS